MHFTMIQWVIQWAGRGSLLLGVVIVALAVLPARAMERLSSDGQDTATAGDIFAGKTDGGSSTAAEPEPASTDTAPVEATPEQSTASAEATTTDTAEQSSRSESATSSSTLQVVSEKGADAAEAKQPPADLQTKPLEPIPDAQQPGPMKVEAASFKGVVPGVTTAGELQKAWGSPRELSKQDGQLKHLYAVEPFEQVEVTFYKGKVDSIVIRLEKAFPAKTVAQQLQLSDIRPVLVSNELGDILGQAFPERGVMFAFEQNHEPGKPTMRVSEIVLEQITADPFILRAETNLDSYYSLNLRDLDQALKLDPQNARAHWLRARVLSAMGNSAEALAAGTEAVKLQRENSRYRVTFAEALDRAGHHKEATEQAEMAVKLAGRRPHVKARAECLLGDLSNSGPKPDYARALKYHMAAIKTADPLAVDRHPAIRLAAKDVLIDAHLGAATDIAWGHWTQKETAVPKWTERAAAFAEELIANDGGTNEHRFRVATRALAAYVGAGGKLDPADWAREAIRVGDELIRSSKDSLQRRQLQWEMGMTLFNTLQVYQIRKEYELALQYGEKTIGYLEAAGPEMANTPACNYLLGRLYFRLGAIHSLAEKNHRPAITWFDKAIPLLEKPLPGESRSELGRHGETFVSMGVSYWETGQQTKAMELTRHGLALMEQAVKNGTLPTDSLAIPYENLAAMQQHLGQPELAARSIAAAKAAKLGGTAAKLGGTKQR